MNKTRRYEYWFYMLVLTVFISCRKDLYYEHCKEVDLHLEITYSLDWHLPCDENWNEKWPAEWTVDWDAASGTGRCQAPCFRLRR